MGVFARSQPLYAAHGIPTFPVRGKRPAVRHYLRMGIPASIKLAAKFNEDDAFGFACQPNSITVIDVDTSDEGVLEAALRRFGGTSIIVRTGSGHFQAWYRHNGERRVVRPFDGVAIDILGGGYVVAPPSETAGGSYSFLSGGLADVTRLPTIKTGALPDRLFQCRGVGDAADTCKVEVGARNSTLWRLCMVYAPQCQDLAGLMTLAVQANHEIFTEPLPLAEVQRLVESAWRYESTGQNFLRGGRRFSFDFEQFDRLASEPDAFFLLSHLKRQHWARTRFVVANAMAAHLGLSLRRFQRARRTLENLGEIVLIRPAGFAGPPLYCLKVRKTEQQ